MDAQARFHRVDELFREAVSLPPQQRAAYLDAECDDDDDLKDDVLALIEEDQRTLGAVDSPALGEELRISGIGLPPPGDSPPIPEAIGAYRIVGKIGEGGMGVVYEAEQENPRRRVALKVMRPGFMSPVVLRRFELESHLLGRLHHPGIAQVYDAGSFDSGAGAQPYFAMEYLEGEPLNRYVRQRNLDANERLRLVQRICDAVQHAHQRGVIHRDLKPGNIIVDESGQPKILDFGVARVTDSDAQITTMQTDVGQLIGTLGYMSPEQVSGDPGAVDTRSDVYAIGVLMYELLADRLPVDISDRTIPEAVRIIQEQEPGRLSTISRVYRGDVDTIVSKALEKDRERRYQSAEAISDDIGHYLRDEPIVARPASTWYQLRKFARRNRALVTAAAAVMLVLIGATAVSTIFAVQRSRQRDRAVETQQKWQQRFDDVRHLANTFMFDVDELLAPVSGTTPARELLVTTALEYLDGLASEVEDDPALQRELADAYLKVGDIQGNPRMPNLGAVEDALASYEKAQRIVDGFIERESDNAANWIIGSRTYERLATVHQYLRDPEVSIRHGERAITLADEAGRRSPTSINAQRVLAAGAGVVGDTYRQMGQLEPAERAYRRAYDVSRKLAAGDEIPGPQRQLSVAANDLGRALKDLDRDDEALELFREAMTIREVILAADPSNVQAQRDLTICCHNVAGILSDREEFEAALEHLVRARDMTAAIVDADPLNARAIQDLTICDEKIGNVLLDLGRTEEALAAFERAVKSRRQLSDSDPANAYLRIGVAIGNERVGDTLRALDRTADAEPLFAEAYEIASELAAADPLNALNQTAAHMISAKLGMVHRDLADAAGAADERRRRLEAAVQWFGTSVRHRDDAAAHEVRLLANPGFDPAEARAECAEELAVSG